MSDEHSHPLLAQVPLTVSPFVSLPTATTLPYTYKSLPSTLPLSSTGRATPAASSSSSNTGPSSNQISKPKYVASSSGHTAHPDEIIASCQALQAHLDKMQRDAEQTLRKWERDIDERELAEKRRVAPGWLDSDAKILQPERTESAAATTTQAAPQMSVMDAIVSEPMPKEDTAGQELDRAFGSMSIQNKG